MKGYATGGNFKWELKGTRIRLSGRCSSSFLSTKGGDGRGQIAKKRAPPPPQPPSDIGLLPSMIWHYPYFPPRQSCDFVNMYILLEEWPILVQFGNISNTVS